MIHFLRQLDFLRWADTTESNSNLPHVLRRLIMATVKGITQIDFPAYEAGTRPGFDGVVVCSGEGHPWVPIERSVWEMGTDKSVKAKADRELGKRSELENTPRDVQESSWFIFVTPRRFDKKGEWVRENASVGYWRGIRALDANDLEHWAESAPPGVVAWLGRLIGSRPVGIDDVVARWDAIANSADHRLVPAVFLAGREQSVDRLRQWLTGEPERLTFECRSPSELVDFFCAAVASMPEQDKLATEARAVIVLDWDAWVTLRDSTTNAVLVIDPAIELSTDEIVRAVRNGHHVLVATESTMCGQRIGELERASQFDLCRALEESGYTPAKAEQFARSAGGSLAILKQRLSPPGYRNIPPWDSGISSEVITACLLLGGWENNEADSNAFAQIVGRPSAECQTELQVMASSIDPMLLHAAGKWRLISKDHTWSIFQDRVSPAALGRFEALCLDILADDDPRYLLPEDERFYANMRGHVPKYSETIKKHVAETLAFLGAFGTELEAASSTDIVATVDRIVASVLPGSCTWHRWASLGPRLPLLAEASPRSFLGSVNEDLKKGDSAFVELLRAEEDALFGRCNHAGLLWALEGLAWSKRLLPEVATALLALSERDTGKSRWNNRPAKALQEILSDWMPHTVATVDERIQVLDLLIRSNNRAAWPILLALLPTADGGFSNPTHMPYWRDWADAWKRGATRGDSFKFITALSERLIELAGHDVSRWKDLFERIGQFPYSVRDRLLEKASSFAESEVADSDRRIVAEVLSEQISRHRHFQNAYWAIPSEVVGILDQILIVLKPRDCVLRNAWLFEQWPDRYFERSGTHDENQAALDRARYDALREILAERGFAGVEQMIQHASSPSDVGRALSMHAEDLYLHEAIPSHLELGVRELAFASGYIWNRFWLHKWTWIDQVMLKCISQSAKAHLLSAVEFSPEAWDRAKAAGPEAFRLYWDRTRAFNPDLDSNAVSLAVRQLLHSKRPLAAIDVLAMALYKKVVLDPDTLFLPLEGLLGVSAEESDQRGQSDRHHIQEIIQALQGMPHADPQRLAFIEWHYIRVLDKHFGHAPLTLQKQLSDSPTFFNEVLSVCYRPRHRDNVDELPDPDPGRKYMAEHGFWLLHEWNVVPGSNAAGQINEQSLRAWCSEARHIASEADRVEVCDNHLGQVFAKSEQADEDGAWPCLAIRKVAEDIATDSLASGISCGIHNLRGAVFRGSGGDEERLLAQQFREKADRIRFDSPFVAKILDSVADSYEKEASWWDERERWEHS